MFRLVSLTGLYAFSVLHAASTTIGPVADLLISSVNISPDGYSRGATLAGGTFPGPVITGNKGDRFSLNVFNNLSDPGLLRSTSIHWHGIHHTGGSNWADGAAFVTQCPISDGESFQYDFRVTGQAGTFWYHSHLSIQYCDGLRGAFIVKDPLDPYRSLYDIDDESTIITLSDWYHATYKGGLPPKADSTLINGKGRYAGGPPTPLAVVNVLKGKRYRFRIISMSCEPSFNFAIDGHTMTVIEADGEYTLPLLVDNIQIHAGQRYSVIVRADQAVSNYWIRANPDPRAFPGFDGGRNSAILRYEGAEAVDPTTSYSGQKPLVETSLHALFNPLAPGGPRPADYALNLVTALDFTVFHFTVNGVTFVPPTAPVLLQILSGAKSAQDLLPKGSVYPLPGDKVIEITLPGTAETIGGPHPFHLHGHHFSVVRSAGSKSHNYLNPVRRDTVATGDESDNVTIRFRTDNAGPWFLHCHMNFHLDLGLAVVFAEDLPDIPKEIHPPSTWDDLCPKYNKSIAGGVY